LYSAIGQNDAIPELSNIERVAEEGFTLVGPYYHQDWQDLRYVYEAAASGLQFTFQLREHPSLVGIPLAERTAAIALLSDADIAGYVRTQVEAIVSEPLANATVARWSVQPEELRYWDAQDLRYLQIVNDTVKLVEGEHDQVNRPLWLYQPNHRTAEQLAIPGEYQDTITKGTYLTTRNPRGLQRAGSAMWSFDQITSAAETLDALPQAVLQLYENFSDPLTGDSNEEIRRVLRHDTYLALVRGIDSLNIFSMWENRPGLTTHNEQFEAYGSVAKELTGPLDLQKVFLFGEDRDDLDIHVLGSADTFAYTHTDGTQHTFPTLNTMNVALGGERYVVLVNSTESQMDVRVAGLPAHYVADDLFAGTSTPGSAQSAIFTLDKLGVKVLRYRQPVEPI